MPPIALVLALFVLLAPCARADTSNSAATLLDRARNATGGSAWDQVAIIRRSYTYVPADGATQTGTGIVDVHSGRYAAEAASTNGLPLRFGWDGQRNWQSQYGISTWRDAALDGADRDAAFIRCLGQWFARCDRLNGAGSGFRKFSDEGEREHGGASYSVVRVVSSGHNPIEYWINRRTWRIGRVGYGIDEGAGPSTIVDYADFRQAGAVQVPFEERTTTTTRAGTRLLHVERVSFVELNPPVPAHAFDKPVDRPITGLAGHPDGVTVDLEQCADPSHLCVPVMLNGRGPFHFMLDSGAALNLITPEAAARLGVRTEGRVMVQGTSDRTSGGALATIARTSLGNLTQEDQTFAVLAIGYPGADGLLGFQWLRQAVTRIDWAARKLTFYDPARFAYRGTAQPRPLDFHGNVPRVEARIDGHAGWFNLDTGDFAGVTVNPTFAHATGLDAIYTSGQETRYGGVGGTAQALLTQARLLEFGDARLQGPQLQLSRQTRDLLSAPGLAGNLGYGVLHHFDIVLDYAHRHVYFEPNAETACTAPCAPPATAL
jgi:hypothetical protein